VHIENLGYAGALADTKVLLMTYANMKPLDPIAHDQLAAWVKAGGQLVYSGTDRDPFQAVQEWWNTGANRYKAPADHLFGKMGIAAGAKEGLYAYGKGSVQIIRTDPKEYAMRANASEDLIPAVQERYRTAGGTLAFKNSFYLRRGPFELVAVMGERVSEEHFTINGTLIDLFDPKLPVYRALSIATSEQGSFMTGDLIKNKRPPQVVSAAYRVYDEESTGNNYSYVAKSPIETAGISRALLPRQPRRVKVNGQDLF